MRTGSDCIFCKIIAGEADGDVVYQDELVTAFMDIHPINPGHVLIVPNEHTPDLAGLAPAYGDRMFLTAQRLAAALRRTELAPEGINLLLADGAAAGQTVFHLHLHVLPRYTGDGFGFRHGVAAISDRVGPGEAAGMLKGELQ